ncbi:hypothetical protein FGO68_gene12185 [Halteria grandinella]|uniref:Potassium channel tetramerisation-type BTB domain-containing protein n=1 Tax=Halteria grandinella TaxID=5974 RepID=A0A8J8NYL1_HALGN|nr:hypothetical protein FGO68_gene12185 [Halteria grandinella]
MKSESTTIVESQGEYLMDIFIDHNPNRFMKVLDCLRDRELPLHFETSSERNILMRDLKTFGPFNNLIKQEDGTLFSSEISMEDQLLNNESDSSEEPPQPTKQEIIVELAHSSNQHHQDTESDIVIEGIDNEGSNTVGFRHLTVIDDTPLSQYKHIKRKLIDEGGTGMLAKRRNEEVSELKMFTMKKLKK